jgi:hypothetical protein
MAHATTLNVAALLDRYAGPTPVVVDLVRKQLLTEDEEERVRRAIRGQIRGDPADDHYSEWLSYSGINLRSASPSVISLVESSTLQRALFDLKLGDHVRSVTLSHYCEIHEARRTIEAFFTEYIWFVHPVDLSRLWWDGMDRMNTQRGAWIPRAFERDCTFLKIVDSWIVDSENLQESLDLFQRHTSIVNNPGRFTQPVFSEAIAIVVGHFMKVR